MMNKSKKYDYININTSNVYIIYTAYPRCVVFFYSFFFFVFFVICWFFLFFVFFIS